MLGGALLGGTAGSLISCREIGVQNETHFMMNEFRKVYHPEGFVVGAKQELPSSQASDPAEPVEVSFVNEDDNAEQQPVEVSRGLSSERKKGGMTERQLKRINIIVDAVREHKVWLKMKLQRLYI